MTAMDIALSRLWKEHQEAQRRAEQQRLAIQFKSWLEASGLGYLADGLGHLPPNVAIAEIFRRAGIHDGEMSLPDALKLLEQRYQPKPRLTQ